MAEKRSTLHRPFNVSTAPQLNKVARLHDHSKILIAVSGGSDSYALLHLLLDAGFSNISAATVDHQLRNASAKEAQSVATHCAALRIDHTTLVWSPKGRSSDAARIGRYELLAEHAQLIGATAIALGHTLDDQAETVFMRAQRLSSQSGTRGLSGMSPVASYKDLKLVRPLLHESRQSLRSYLKNLDQCWIDDPSNIDPKSERVRVRHYLLKNPDTPSIRSIAKLAELTSVGRRWLSELAAKTIDDHAYIDPTGDIILKDCSRLPTVILEELFSTLVLVAGGQDYRTPVHKLRDVVLACTKITPLRKTVGNALINVKRGSVTFSKEVRKQLQVAQTNANTLNSNSILSLELFRSSDDDPQFGAIIRMLEKYGRST